MESLFSDMRREDLFKFIEFLLAEVQETDSIISMYVS